MRLSHAAKAIRKLGLCPHLYVVLATHVHTPDVSSDMRNRWGLMLARTPYGCVALLSHLEQKRGASAGITGHSNDLYQDILREAITSIMSLCNLIAIGSLPDGPARKLLLSGKGTALHKSPTGIRPKVTLVPCGQYTSHTIATEYKAHQFMGVLHGCEIVSHLVRHQLVMDHSKVMITTKLILRPSSTLFVMNYQPYYHMFCSSLRCPRSTSSSTILDIIFQNQCPQDDDWCTTGRQFEQCTL